MVKHIVFWKLKDEVKRRGAGPLLAGLRESFSALVGKVDGLTAIELGENYNGGEYDVALCCTFTTREAEAGYQNHPDHVAIKGRVHEITCGRACEDYEL